MPDGYRNHGEEIHSILSGWLRGKPEKGPTEHSIRVPVDCPICGSFAGRCSIDDDAGITRCGMTGRPMEEPTHRPLAPDAPIPGVHHYSGCDPDGATVGPDGRCRGCGDRACPDCGYEVCDCRLSPDDLRSAAEALSLLNGIDEGTHTDSDALRRLETLLRREATRSR